MTSIEALVDRQLNRYSLRQQAESASPAAAGEARGPLRVITVSRQAGSGGHMLATRLAGILGFEFVDRQVIDYITQNTGAREKLIESLDSRTQSGVDLWVEGVLRGRYVDRSEYTNWLIKSITAMAEHGNTVILGRAGNVILRERGGLHVRVVAPRDRRVANLIEHAGITQAEAEERVRELDEQRRKLYADDFGADIDNPLDYHLVINTGRMTQAGALEMVLGAWRRMMV
jgi:cytidylate kinase